MSRSRPTVTRPGSTRPRNDRSAIIAASVSVMGRDMSGPVRGAWDRRWNGWWSEDPPFHAPVFVLTHHAREPQPMDGGATYHFVTGGITSAPAQARGTDSTVPRATGRLRRYPFAHRFSAWLARAHDLASA